MEGQDAVLTRDGDDVRGDADGHKLEQPLECAEGDVVALRKGLHELEAHAAAAEMGVGILGVGAFGIEHGHGGGQLVVGHVVVADDEVHAALVGVGHLVDGFDAAVERDDECDATADGVVDALERDAVALIVAVGDVVFDRRGVGAEEFVDQRHGRCAVHVVIAINHDPLLVAQSLVEALDSLEHVGHQEGVVQVAEVGVEVVEGLVGGGDTSLHEQQADDWVKPQRGGQCVSEVYLLFRLGSDVPSVCHYLLWFCFCRTYKMKTETPSSLR